MNWTKLKGNIPPARVNLLVVVQKTNDYGSIRRARLTGFHSKGIWRTTDGKLMCGKGERVTHWMPLPEYPKED